VCGNPKKGVRVVTKEVLDAGTVVVLAVVVISPLIAVIGFMARWAYNGSKANADATNRLNATLVEMTKTFQSNTDAQVATERRMTSIETKFSDLSHKIDKLPEHMKVGVVESLDTFLDKLTLALRESGSVPATFSMNHRRRGLLDILTGR